MSASPRESRILQMAPWFGEEERAAVAEYMESGGWFTEFSKTREFEQAIAAFTGSPHAIAVTSGTAALFCALSACGIGPGDEVLVPAFTMVATANAVLLAGATPVFVDIHPANLCMDLDAAGQAVTERTRAILLVSLNGRAPDMTRALSFASRHSLKLIEDAAQSLGSTQAGKALGSFGCAGAYSFGPLKIISTGQGGAVVTADEKIAQRLRRFKDFGRERGGVDVHESIGYNFKFTDLQAAVGVAQMRKLAWRVERKKEIFALYREELRGAPGIRFLDTDLAEVTPWFIDILTDRRDDLRRRLSEAGIEARPFYPPVHLQPAYRWKGRFPAAEEASARGLWLPSSSFLSDAEIGRVCAVIRAWAGLNG
ncbi:MAG TPA: DegT/DnrJ/EryC1/StrS family aminotransferase [Bryobacteraceae bacterium]|nr:DegT/DnrJ/EryC1/StrS family aminotransferase [Bryobacteraceae bacterium]